MNAHEGKAGMVLFEVKLCDPCLSTLCVPWCKKALYKYSSFPSFPYQEKTFLPSTGFRVVDVRVQMVVFVVSVKPEVVVCQPEVVLQDRKWLPLAQIQPLKSH